VSDPVFPPPHKRDPYRDAAKISPDAPAHPPRTIVKRPQITGDSKKVHGAVSDRYKGTSKHVLSFHCPACFQDARALVVGVGRLSRQESSRENAELTLKLASCPHCLQRDESSVMRMKSEARASVLVAVAITLALTPVLAFVGARHPRFIDDFALALACTGPLGLYFGWALWRSQCWRWQTIDQRVAFIPEGRTVEEFHACRELVARYPDAI
jgi:hypothetical protein